MIIIWWNLKPTYIQPENPVPGEDGVQKAGRTDNRVKHSLEGEIKKNKRKKKTIYATAGKK